MDLRHARTFVAVAELGTVSKAAQQLRIAQPALSRQINHLERELGLKLFDRVGRRLMMTGEGEQLLGDCRTLLSCAMAVGERARQLQGGETGVLKVASSPQIIEGTMPEFLRRYAQCYPKVQVRLTEAIGWADTVRMLEHGEVQLGQNLMSAAGKDQRFSLATRSNISIFSPPAARRSRSGVTAGSRLRNWRHIHCCCWTTATSFAGTSTPPAVSPGWSRILPMKAGLHMRCSPWPKAGMALPSFRRACGPTAIACDRRRHLSRQAVAGTSGHLLGQAKAAAALCYGLLRHACRLYARGVPNLETYEGFEDVSGKAGALNSR